MEDLVSNQLQMDFLILHYLGVLDMRLARFGGPYPPPYPLDFGGPPKLRSEPFFSSFFSFAGRMRKKTSWNRERQSIGNNNVSVKEITIVRLSMVI